MGLLNHSPLRAPMTGGNDQLNHSPLQVTPKAPQTGGSMSCWDSFDQNMIAAASSSGRYQRMTQEQWAAAADNLGLPSGQAEQLAAAVYSFLGAHGYGPNTGDLASLAQGLGISCPSGSSGGGNSGGGGSNSGGGSGSGGNTSGGSGSGSGATSDGGSTSGGTSGSGTSAGSGSSLFGSGGIMDWITANPLLAAGGAAGVAFLLFGRRRR